MKVYSPTTRKGRVVSCDDVHHKTADQPKKAAKLQAKRMKHAARQQAKKSILDI